MVKSKSKPSHLECPKCGGRLIIDNVPFLINETGGTVPRTYACPKCGYMGQVGLEPGIIKLDKRKKL